MASVYHFKRGVTVKWVLNFTLVRLNNHGISDQGCKWLGVVSGNFEPSDWGNEWLGPWGMEGVEFSNVVQYRMYFIKTQWHQNFISHV